jgi:hypothetical protein
MFTLIAYHDDDPATEFRVGLFFDRDDACRGIAEICELAGPEYAAGWNLIPVQVYSQASFLREEVIP